jgi:integrase/recombinase XerD
MIEDYLLYLKNEKGNAPASCCLVLTGLRFFYKHVGSADRNRFPTDQKTAQASHRAHQRSGLENHQQYPKNIKHRLMLMTTYAAGLRVGELRRLKPEHIDSQRMLIKVVDGKGCAKTATPCCRECSLEELRRYYQACRPATLPVPIGDQKEKDQPLSYEAVRCIYEKARKKAGVKNGEGCIHCAQLCHPSVGGRIRHPQNPGPFGP